jgi:hypothetical protein
MTMQHTHFSSDYMPLAVEKLEQVAAKVPAIVTAASTRQSRDRLQVVDNTHAPVAQPG